MKLTISLNSMPRFRTTGAVDVFPLYATMAHRDKVTRTGPTATTKLNITGCVRKLFMIYSHYTIANSPDNIMYFIPLDHQLNTKYLDVPHY
jgi:hypothetical protein